jgi:hypothetical protein
MAEVKSRGVKIRNVFVLAGTVLAIFVPIWFAAAALGTKFGLWSWNIGLVKMIGGIGLPLIGLTVLVTFVTSLLVVFIKPRAGFGALAAMWLVCLGAVGMGLSIIGAAREVPPIHDISTDTSAPLTFSAKIMGERGAASNKVLPPSVASVPFNKDRLTNWSGRTLTEIQAEAYPNIKSLVIADQTPAALYPKALASAKSNGLRIVVDDASTLRIEGVAESLWFGFKDDVAIAITPSGTGSKVDVRSISRVGISDMGANAKRIEAILAGIKA